MWYTAGKDFNIPGWCGVCGSIKGVRPSQRPQSTEFPAWKEKTGVRPLYCAQHSGEDGFVARFFFFPSVFVLLGLFVSVDSLGDLSRVISLG
jgi:hypothetical protein